MSSNYTKAITIYDEYGKPKRKYIRAKTQDELDKKVTETKYLRNKGFSITNENITLKDLGEKWFNLKQSNNEEATKKRNYAILNNYIYPKLGHISLKNLKSYQIQELVNEQIRNGKKDTVRKTLQIIKSIINLAVENDYTYKNVANSISIPKFQTAEKKILSKEERIIIENSKNKYKDFFVFLLYSGLRKGEIAALTWSDIDLKNNVINVNKSATFVHNQPQIKSTKNGKSRNVPILNKTREILERRFNDKHSKYVFYKKDYNILSDIAIKRMLESLKKDTGLNFSLHQLRHTFCTILYYSGISSKKAQEIMGHSSIDVTLKIYTHLDDEQESNSTSKINDYINCCT